MQLHPRTFITRCLGAFGAVSMAFVTAMVGAMVAAAQTGQARPASPIIHPAVGSAWSSKPRTRFRAGVARNDSGAASCFICCAARQRCSNVIANSGDAKVKIVIPDDYQDMVDQLQCFSMIRHHDVKRYREPARDLDQLVERLKDADVVVSIRERVEFSRALLERLPKLKLLALVGRNSHMLDFAAATDLGIPFPRRQQFTGCAGRVDAGPDRRVPAQHRARSRTHEARRLAVHAVAPVARSTLGIFGLGAIGQLVAAGGRGLGMNVLVFGQKNSLEKAAAAGYEAAKSKADLFERSDVLSLSVRLRPETKGIVGPRISRA